MIFFPKYLEKDRKDLYLHSSNERALSSVGSEHLPYKQGVVGSNPTGPTHKKPDTKVSGFFYLRPSEIRFCKRLNKNSHE